MPLRFIEHMLSFYPKHKSIHQVLPLGKIHSWLTQQLYGFFHALIQLINHLEIFIHIPNVTGQQSFQLVLTKGKAV